MFVGVHALLAARMATPELELSEDEGTQFMKAAQNVMRHYSVKTTQKTMDVVALMGVVVAIYAPRMAAIRMRHVMEKREAQNADQNNVVHFSR